MIRESIFFDHTISRSLDISANHPNCLSTLLFEKHNFRDEDSIIIQGHVGNEYVEISLKQLRFIIFSLFKQFKKKGINIGDTIFLANIPGNNELFIALMFAALTSYGAKVLLPMFIEINDILEWLEQTFCQTIFLPEQDIMSLHHHEREKQIIKEIRDISKKQKLYCFDIFTDFGIKELLFKTPVTCNYREEELYTYIINNTSLNTESLLITTSGSSGKSKLVRYRQKAFILSCLSWQQSGMFNHELLGGRCFTPMFSHTMGIRALFNAVWTGFPICLINTDWFLEKPEIVRYFLLKMKPEHITGGPSIYNLLLELMRCFPELKNELPQSFKTLISSGAPIDKKTISEIESSFGIKMHNAYGTTETQQALNTILLKKPDKTELESLGAILPGIKIGLKNVDGEKELFELYINSPFGMDNKIPNYVENLKTPQGYFRTGDIVRMDNNKLLFYEGRENQDFIKDGFGVKVPLNTLHRYYQKIIDKIEHIEFYPIKGVPGLAALVFIDNKNAPEGVIKSENLLKEFSGQISEINNQLFKTLEPFEYRHRSIERFILINSKVPKTIKGNISRFKIKTSYTVEINKLTDLLSEGSEIKDVKPIDDQLTTLSHHHNPYLGKMLTSLGIDYSYFKAKKDSLYTLKDDEEIEVLDFTGGFGTNLLGHNNDQIKSTIRDFIKNDEIPISDQGSIQKYVGALAEKLNSIVGKITHKSYNVIFGSTGSEAVEISLHHALLSWKKSFEKMKQIQYQRYGDEAGDLITKIWDENTAKLKKQKVSVIALKDSFHGHSSGARSILGNSKKRETFINILGISTVFIDDTAKNWKVLIEKELAKNTIELKKIVRENKTITIQKFNFSTILAAIAEPIIGEGGIRQVNFELLNFLSEYSFPLIMDEIQCGLGRSGLFLASEGINANYYLFAKSLGGNFEKISAVLIEKNQYIDEFSDYYSSTFANGGLAARVALKTLSIIEEDNICIRAKKAGQIISEELENLKQKYSKIVLKITGKGLMQGIHFCDLSKSSNFILRCLYNQKYLGLLFSSYLLKKFQIRILPSISSPNVLRIEPSAYISKPEISKLIIALENICEDIHQGHFYTIFKPLMDDDPFTDHKGKIPDEGFMYSNLDEPSPGAKKVAMIAHFVYPTTELRALEKNFCKASDTGLRILFNRFQVLMQMKPFVLFSKNILNNKIHFSIILIPIDSAELEKLFRQKKQRKIIEKVQESVRLADELGIQTVSLGAYTSIISNNGLSLSETGQTKIITGNTLTAASGIKRLKDEINKHNLNLSTNVLGIVGAAGNIGSILTSAFLNSDIPFQKLILFGRNSKKIENIISETTFKNSINKNTILEKATDLNLLKECNVIIVASNTNDPIVFPHHLSRKKQIIISDLSVPSAVSEEIFSMKNVIPASFASYITIPGEPDFLISSHTPKGTIFCCAAEAVLDGLEPINSRLKGKISLEGVSELTEIAEKYNFFNELGDVKTFKTN